MPERQAEIADLEVAMADPALFAKQPTNSRRRRQGSTAARGELESHELEWLELEEKRDSLGRRLTGKLRDFYGACAAFSRPIPFMRSSVSLTRTG